MIEAGRPPMQGADYDVVFSQGDIERRVRELGTEITEAYSDEEELLVLGLLKGSFIFVADLVRHIHRPLQVDFLVAASYGSGTVSSGEVELLYDPGATLKDRAVLIVEDIIDSGTTLSRVVPMLEARGPNSLDVCALLHKRKTTLKPEPRWVGFDAPEEFLVGYGLDYSEQLRHLSYIASIRKP
jgi:hypoxanthine phosphoribosyltransferase